MDKDIWDILIKAGLALIAVWTLYYKRTEIIGITHKDYTAKLDSTVRFFDKFYKNNKENKLTLDRSAQELTRSDFVDYELMVYLIELNEKRLVSFDHLIRLYKHGRKFLVYKPSMKVNSSSFDLKIKKGRSIKKQIQIWNFTYVVSAFLFLAPFIFPIQKYYDFLDGQFNVIFAIYACAYIFGTAIFAISSLVNATDLRDAESFLKEIESADQKIATREEDFLKNSKQKIVSNESWYVR